MPPVSRSMRKSANAGVARNARRMSPAHSCELLLRFFPSCRRITASCCPELVVYAADQSGFRPISETIISRSAAGTVSFRNRSTSLTRSSVASKRRLDGARRRKTICPASTCGKNSRPMNGTTASDPLKSRHTAITTLARLPRHHRRAAKYPAANPSMRR